MNCPICNKELKYMPSRHASKHGMTIEQMKELYPDLKYSPTQGIKFSDETRDKMRIKSDKYYESIKLQDRKGSKNSFFGKSHTLETRKRIGRDVSGDKNPFYGKTHNEKSRLSMSSTRSEGIAKGLIPTRYHNSGTYVSIKTGNIERYDSKLELYRMIQMDEDSSIKNWTKKHGIKITYNDKGKLRNYVPDFYVIYENGESCIEEVKGWDVKAKNKLEALQLYCNENQLLYKWHWQDDDIFSGYKKWIATNT